MKKLFYYIFSALMTLSIYSCSEAEPDVYNGDSLLNFNQGSKIDESVLIGTNSKDIKVTYGTIKAVTGTHQVKLVFDAAKSTAVPGVDFTIANDTHTINAGEVMGEFGVNLVEPAQGVEKVAVFKLQSATLPYAVFDQELTLTWRLQCTIDSFLNNSTSAFFNAAPELFGGPWPVEIEMGTEPNTLIIKDYIETGYNIKLTYDANGRITFDPHQTGYMHPTYGMISMRMSGQTSTYDACNRKMTLKAEYYVNAGSFGDMTDQFTGL